MEFDNNNITHSHTGSEVEKFEKTFFDDGEFSGYMIFFTDGYKLEIDRDEITEDDLNFLIKKKIYVDIEYRLGVWKGRYPKTYFTGKVTK